MRFAPIVHAQPISLQPKGAGRSWIAPLCALALAALVRADQSAQTIPFAQNWSSTGLITVNDNWSGVAGIEGYLGQDITTGTGTDPQTLLGVSSVANDLDVIANQTSTGITNGGVGEFHTTSQAGAPGTNPVVALQGSGTADAPYLLITLTTTAKTGINVAYNLRDIDCTTDNAVMPVALQYRVGNTGSFTNVPAGFVADATTGPSLCTTVTPVSVTLPAAVDNQPVVQVRIMTTNAVGNDEWVGIDDISVTTVIVVDNAPTVSSTTPTNGATGVALGANVSVTFSEAVNAPASAFSLSCASTGLHSFVLSGGPATFTLNPDSDFIQNELCTVSVDDAQVTDVDVDDPPDTMAADYVFTFTTVDLSACGTAFTHAYTIQGSGTASPLVSTSATTEGVVVGDFQGLNNLKGFYIQDEAGDGDPATSDGLFISDGNTPAVDVAVGDHVRVSGTVSESFNLTQIFPVTSVLVCSTGNALPTPTTVSLPEAVDGDLEKFENMLVSFPQALTVSGNFGLGRFGELVLSSGGRLFQQNLFDPANTPASAAVEELNLRRYITLDDGLSLQNPDPTPFTDVNSTRRLGDTVTGLQGILTFDFSEYRVQPTVTPIFVSANPRTPSPAAVGGNVKVSSFNVLNYFNGDGLGGGFPTSRGASTLAEFNRQRAKVIAAILGANTDVNGIIEMENDGNGTNSAIQDLVNGLNAATAPGTYAFREGVTPGTDLIKNSIIYKPAVVTPVGAAFNDTDAIWTGQARNPLAQTFSLNANGESFVFIVNHFTSKGCSVSDTGLDADQGDGQGCDNLERRLQAEALLEFVKERQDTTGVARVISMGDLNADGEEDPIAVLENDPNDTLVDGAGGLIDLAQAFVAPADRHSYQFGDRSGHIDHAFSSKALFNSVSGATIWNINADEPTILDYNVEFKTPGQQALNVGTPYRASDHDPVVVGLNLVPPAAPTVTTPTSASITATTATLGGNVTSNGGLTITERGVVYSVTTTNGDPVILGTGVIKVSTSGTTGVFTVGVAGLTPLTGYSFKAYATNSQGTGYTSVATFTTLTACPTITPGSLPNGTLGVAYPGSAAASGGVGPYTYALTAGALPTGLSLVLSGAGAGGFTGTPSATGSFGFQITATDANGCSGAQPYTVYIGSVIAAGDLVIREFRLRGPGVGVASDNDEYLVIHNKTTAPLTIASTDGSGGFGVAKEGGALVFAVPDGTVIPAKGHFLGANTTNGSTFLGVTPDATWGTDIADGLGLGLFTSAATFTAPNVLDAVGFTPGLYAEGTVLPSLGAAGGEYAWVRKAQNGVVQDTNSNLGTVANPGDFTLVSTDGTVGKTYNGVPSVLGAPSPIGLNTWDVLSDFTVTVADPLIGVNNVPNRARLVDAPGGGDRMEFRRRITNNSSTTFTSLRLRLVDVTVVNSPGYATATPTQADMRPNTSVNVTVTSSLASPSPGPISPLGLTLLTPPVQANFGGLNSILTIPGGPLGPGQSRDVNMSFKIFRVGGYRFLATIEAK